MSITATRVSMLSIIRVTSPIGNISSNIAFWTKQISY